MDPLALLFSRSGHIARQPFAIAIVGVYLASFFSQSLLGEPILSKAGVWPVACLQAALAWMWTVLHVKRLRDAGRSPGVAVAFACIYAIALLVVLAIVLSITMGSSGSNETPGGGNLIPFLFVIYLFAALFGGLQLNALAYLLMAFAMLLFTPVLIGFGYSIWVGTRPSDQPVPLPRVPAA